MFPCRNTPHVSTACEHLRQCEQHNNLYAFSQHECVTSCRTSISSMLPSYCLFEHIDRSGLAKDHSRASETSPDSLHATQNKTLQRRTYARSSPWQTPKSQFCLASCDCQESAEARNIPCRTSIQLPQDPNPAPPGPLGRPAGLPRPQSRPPNHCPAKPEIASFQNWILDPPTGYGYRCFDPK